MTSAVAGAGTGAAAEREWGVSSRDLVALSRLAWPGSPAAAPLEVEPVGYPFGSPNTGGLFRLRRPDGSGGPPSVFVKVLRSYRHWPLLHVLPPDVRAQALVGDWWRYEADVYVRGQVARTLPPGLRLPRCFGVHDLGDERLAVVLEDVADTPDGWDRPRFRRAAYLLGRLAVRLTRLDPLPEAAMRRPGEWLRLMDSSRLQIAALPALSQDATWRTPVLAAAVDPGLRGDLDALAGRLPALLDTVERLPQVLGHGDASPQNLLVPRGRADEFVAIDWSFGFLAAVGDDLGQLLVGLVHAGRLSATELPALREVLVAAYTAGLADEGMTVDAEQVRYGMDAGLVVRSAFTALPLERLGEPPTPKLADLFGQRARLTRYLVDLGLALPVDGPAAPAGTAPAGTAPAGTAPAGAAAAEVRPDRGPADPVELHPGERTVLLRTRRRDGTWVGTPVMPVPSGRGIYVGTPASTGKVKRLRNFPEVQVAPCTFRGRRTGPVLEAQARLLEGTEAVRAERALRRRYPVTYGVVVPLELRLRRTQGLYYELTDLRAPRRPRTDPAATATPRPTPAR